MVTISLDELPANVRKQVEALKPGETATIVQGNDEVAEVRRAVPHVASQRPIGLCEGQFIVPDSFFEPLPDTILKAFEGGA